MEHVVASVVSGLFGFVIAPLLIFAMPRSLVRERYRAVAHHCMNCGDAFSGEQYTPLVAYVTSKGRCATCRVSVSGDTPWFEILLVVLLSLTGFVLGPVLELPAYLVFIAVLFAISVIDLRHYIIPNKLLYPAFFLCIALLVGAGLVQEPHKLLTAFIGMAGSWMFFFAFWFVSPRGLGFGDVRLSAFNGFMAGYIAVGNAVLAVILGLLFASVIGIGLIAFRVKGRKDSIPFGPFLALGAAVAVLGPLAAG